MRNAVTAARIGAPGGAELLAGALRREADRYAAVVLALPPAAAVEVAEAAVARTVKGLPKRLDVEEIDDRLALAVRTEAFARQPGSRGNGRFLAAAALLVVVLGFGAFALSLGGPDSPDAPPEMALSVETLDREVTLQGQVVVAGEPPGDADLTDVAVQVRLADQPIATARTDADGRFRMSGLTADIYDVRVAAPDGLRLADGSTTIDLTDRDADVDAVVLRLERP